MVNSFVFIAITNKELKKEILNLPNTEAVGVGSFKTETRKMLVNYVIQPFRYLLNCCVNEDIYPTSFKRI